jgi:hypothetical protein
VSLCVFVLHPSFRPLFSGTLATTHNFPRSSSAPWSFTRLPHNILSDGISTAFGPLFPLTGVRHTIINGCPPPPLSGFFFTSTRRICIRCCRSTTSCKWVLLAPRVVRRLRQRITLCHHPLYTPHSGSGPRGGVGTTPMKMMHRRESGSCFHRANYARLHQHDGGDTLSLPIITMCVSFFFSSSSTLPANQQEVEQA